MKIKKSALCIALSLIMVVSAVYAAYQQPKQVKAAVVIDDALIIAGLLAALGYGATIFTTQQWKDFEDTYPDYGIGETEKQKSEDLVNSWDREVQRRAKDRAVELGLIDEDGNFLTPVPDGDGNGNPDNDNDGDGNPDDDFSFWNTLKNFIKNNATIAATGGSTFILALSTLSSLGDWLDPLLTALYKIGIFAVHAPALPYDDILIDYPFYCYYQKTATSPMWQYYFEFGCYYASSFTDDLENYYDGYKVMFVCEGKVYRDGELYDSYDSAKTVGPIVPADSIYYMMNCLNGSSYDQCWSWCDEFYNMNDTDKQEIKDAKISGSAFPYMNSSNTFESSSTGGYDGVNDTGNIVFPSWNQVGSLGSTLADTSDENKQTVVDDWLDELYGVESGADNDSTTDTSDETTPDTGTDTDSGDETTSGTGTDSGTDIEGGTTPGTGTDTDSDTDTDTGTGTDTDTGTQAGTHDSIENAQDLDKNQFLLPETITEKFPFCVPFDIIRAFTLFDNDTRAAPKITLPLKAEKYGINYEMEIDLSVYDEVAELLRNLELIAFVVGLALVSRDLIKG